jgi:hypothetical protein
MRARENPRIDVPSSFMPVSRCMRLQATPPAAYNARRLVHFQEGTDT